MAARLRWALGCFVAILTCCTLTAGPDKDADEMARGKILERFVQEFVSITLGEGRYPATFEMGSADPKAPATERPQAVIKFRTPFAMARYEVTQEVYEAIMGRNPSKWKGPRNSVEMVNHSEADEFCRKVTTELRRRKLLGEDEVIRLPSEAEWEFCCRAGTKTAWCFGDNAGDLTDFGWFKGNAAGNDPPVGRKKPNAWGFHDMHGYVWEWCADAWSPTHAGAAADGTARTGKGDFVIRGGSWADDADSARSAFRARRAEDFRSDAIGFRCVRAAIPKK